MEIQNLKEDIKVFYITAVFFPDGIQELIKKTHTILPNGRINPEKKRSK